MSRLLVQGGKALDGEVDIHGAKNSTLPILAATILTGGETVLQNCPKLRDVEVSIRILQYLGCSAGWDGDALVVNTKDMNRHHISDGLMREMRSSSIFLGAILARCGKANLSYPGGCELGPRPIDMHLAGLRQLGATITETGGRLDCETAGLTGRTLVLRLPSVGATENLMIAACGATGTTTILNAAREPEIVDLQNYLLCCGARMTGAGTSTIIIEGKAPLHDCTYACMSDRIVAATYLCAVASAGGRIYLKGAKEEHLSTVIALLREAGCQITSQSQGIVCRAQGRLQSVQGVKTAPYPGFPTDAQAVVMAALLKSCGATMLEENLFENRFRHVDELKRMGADIQVSGRVAVVTGVEMLHGASVEATDLRGGAALCVAGLGAQGDTWVSGLDHIDRGYESIERDLCALGGEVTRI
ncbi:UDP-N-acetylglucosamine 1-carboxyvinyltransferase [Bengtsoniella intestinalis]|uniref:UDP-N-acetylglucosamine 1-carboxyvinyltransferase n=1 Tax=Bengtsoniella intestinalis TaxID=3073143 RepID=UPI00391F62EB